MPPTLDATIMDHELAANLPAPRAHTPPAAQANGHDTLLGEAQIGD
jgi:hypothetical protein